jgi:dolichyl-phosphate-mannose--protein O-mannosyl transferase
MANLSLPTYVTPTQAVSWYNLILIGTVGGLGVMVLSELVKDKQTVPTSEITKWTLIFGAVALVSIWDITRSSKA